MVYEKKAPGGWSAYSPEVPGCVSTGATREDASRNMQEALGLHLAGLRAKGLPVPEGTSQHVEDFALESFALGLIEVV